MGKKALCGCGIAVGAIMAIIGLAMLIVEPSLNKAGYQYLQYDYGFTTFGGDSYTYINNNVYFAALALINLTKMLGGVTIMAGLATACFFGMKLISAIEQEKTKEVEDVSSKQSGKETGMSEKPNNEGDDNPVEQAEAETKEVCSEESQKQDCAITDM